MTLLDKILLEAELLELKANPEKHANGTVIEASLDKGRGYVATILGTKRNIETGRYVGIWPIFRKVKAMFNERNQRIEIAPHQHLF